MPAVLVVTGPGSALHVVARRLRRAGLRVKSTTSQQRALSLLQTSALALADSRLSTECRVLRVGGVYIHETPSREPSRDLFALVKEIVRATQERQQRDALFQAAPDGIIWLDRRERIRLANPAAARILGCANRKDLHGQPIESYMQLRPANPGAPGSTLLALNSRGEQVCWRDDGKSVPVEYEIGPLVENGRQAGAVLTFRDISERRTVERFKDELVGVVSHELRAPLTSMRSSLGLLASGRLADLPDGARRMLDIAVINTDRLIRLVNDLLDLERLEKGQMPMDVELCHMSELIDQAADSLRPLALSLGVALDVTPSPARLRGDPDRLLQVLINLMSNALKFSPVGGTVWVDSEQFDGELTLRVRDQGRGIPSEKLDTVFNRFVQVEAADGRDNKGTGLGLAICRGIVRQHGGQIWAESTLSVGTTFFVALPCEDTDVVEYDAVTRARAA